jgi:hypothetical protein
MKHLLLAVFVVVGLSLFVSPPLKAQAFQWGLYDGVAATPVRLRGNLNATVVRTSTGFYKLTFTAPVYYVQVTSLTGGTGGDVTPTVASVTYDTSNARVIYLTIYGIYSGTPAGTSKLTPLDGRFSIEVRR